MPSPAQVAGLAALTALALWCASCTSSHSARSEIHGRLASGGGYLGDWDFYPRSCAVHDDEVVLIDDTASLKRVRLVDRTRMPSTRNAKIDVHVAKDTPSGAVDLIFTDPSCVKSALASGPRGYGGEVSLDCNTGEGGHVVGTITFDGCR